MFKIFIKIFILLLFPLTILLIYLAVDTKARRYVLNQVISIPTIYYYHKVSEHAYNRDFENGAKQILNYINLSKKLAGGKNSMLQGIFTVTELLTSKAITQDDFNKIEIVYKNINEISDDIYKINVWLAKAVSDTNVELAKKHLMKAIRLSPGNQEAYRELLTLYANNKIENSLFSEYCTQYNHDLHGSTVDRTGIFRDSQNFFKGDNSTFAIAINENNENLYTKFFSELNQYKNYKITFQKKKNINSISVLKNFFPGSKFYIRNIFFKSVKDKKVERINLNNLYAYSLNSYVLDNSNSELVFLNSDKYKSDIIYLKLKKTFQDITEINIEIKIQKLNLSNLICDLKNEN